MKAFVFIAIGIMAISSFGAGQKDKNWTMRKPPLMPGDSITLQWCPKDSIDTSALSPVKKCEIELTIQDVIDSRTNKAFLGKNVEGKAEKNVYVKGDFGLWIQQHLEKYLSGKCTDVSKKYLVGITIIRFDIIESKRYVCSWEAEVTVKGADSKLLSKQKLSASAETWGRSFTENNYSMVTSNGVVQLVNLIMGLGDFKNR
jgi:hypothetical protein